MARWNRVVVLVLAAGLAITGCDGAGSDSASSDSESAEQTSPGSSASVSVLRGVRVTVVQQRIDEGTRRIGLELSTDAKTSVDVLGYRLRSPGFRPVPLRHDETAFAPEQTIDLATVYGTPRCDIEDPTRGLAATIAVNDPTGQPRSYDVPITGSGVQLVRRLHARECAEVQLQRATSITYAPFSRAQVDGRTVLKGALVLQRPDRGGSREPVVIDSMLGSVLFDFRPLTQSAPGVARLASSARRLRLPVSIGSSGRCDQHTRSQSTQTFLFSVYVRVGHAEEHRSIAIPPPRLQRQALALVDDVC